MAMTRSSFSLCAALLLLAACGEKDVDASGDTDAEVPAEGDACDPAVEAERDEDAPACAEELSCEASGDTYICAAPIEIHGIVLDAVTEDPIEGAHVTALDEVGNPVDATPPLGPPTLLTPLLL